MGLTASKIIFYFVAIVVSAMLLKEFSVLFILIQQLGVNPLFMNFYVWGGFSIIVILMAYLYSSNCNLKRVSFFIPNKIMIAGFVFVIYLALNLGLILFEGCSIQVCESVIKLLLKIVFITLIVIFYLKYVYAIAYSSTNKSPIYLYSQPYVIIGVLHAVASILSALALNINAENLYAYDFSGVLKTTRYRIDNASSYYFPHYLGIIKGTSCGDEVCYRAQSFFHEPSYAAFFIMPSLIIAYGNSEKLWSKMAVLVVFLLTLYVINSTTAYLSLVGVILFSLIFSVVGKIKKNIFAVFFVLVMLLYASIMVVSNDFTASKLDQLPIYLADYYNISLFNGASDFYRYFNDDDSPKLFVFLLLKLIISIYILTIIASTLKQSTHRSHYYGLQAVLFAFLFSQKSFFPYFMSLMFVYMLGYLVVIRMSINSSKTYA